MIFTRKQKFRLSIVISIFWVIGWLLFSLSFHGHWLFSKKMYMFIVIGIVPTSLFWSYYWIKSAKD